jgi:hypothetical protein
LVVYVTSKFAYLKTLLLEFSPFSIKLLRSRLKGKLIPMHAMKACKWSRVIAPLTLTLALQGIQMPQLKHKNIPFRQILV